MCNSCDYTIHGRHHHFGWDNSFAPAERVAPGATIEFQCLDAAGGQLNADSTVAEIVKLDFAGVNPVTGPIFVEGAEPGDALKVTIEMFKPSGFGWTANIPGFGLLADDFTEPALNIWKYDAAALEPALFGKNARVPLKPFAGTIGNAPAEMGLHSVVPPRRVGGNLDIRDLAAGTTLYLPVEVAGALFSVGDTHAAQGDGEVCGTAIESPMDVVLKLDLVKDARLKTPRFTTPGPVTSHLDAKGYEVTTGIGPDLMAGAKEAVAQMVDLLAGRYQIDPVEAYMLASVCGDLRISEIVDMPNWVVSFYFPRCVFE
ncbi:acetamidase/formamidase family protein [Mesorhizobium sp. L2C066B000]|uniref:acetamidase/formamidase family protein n=1 Tax=Mesorhizobium sp. L2C066B000 TaxID=1287105 RepID=UPI0003D02DDB|nr:acetamidase/formamidase family protein [Mesorhizobium sp. L2C066B000]ESZ40446.1 acetamidase [Mesorhizobium sp. L2C066B000]